MDIVGHGIYSVALNKTADKKVKSIREIAVAFFWGVMPDLFAMGPSFLIALSMGSLDHHAYWNGHDISGFLYPLTHSLVIFAFVLFVIRWFLKKWYLPMLGWGFHIIFDIPFHTQEFYPTPFLYPVSTYTLPIGFYWGTPALWVSLWAIGITWLIWAFYRSSSEPRDS